MQSQNPAYAVTRPDLALFSLLLLVDSLHFVFARALAPYFDPALGATLVMVVATVQVGLFAWQRRVLDWRIMTRHFSFFAIVGACVAASTALTYASVNYIDAGTASMLGRMSMLFTLLIGYFWLHERLQPVQTFGALVSIMGVFVITFQSVDILRFGSILVIISTAAYALHTAVVKRHGEQIDFINFFFFRLLFTTLFLVLFAIARPQIWTPAPAAAWWLVLVAGTVDVVISRSLYYLSLRRLSMSIHAIILTVSPVISIVWAFFLFNTFPTPQQLAGGVAVLAGVLIATLYRRSIAAPQSSP